MDKKKIYSLLLFISVCVSFQAPAEDAYIMSMVVCGYIKADEEVQVDDNLDFTSFRLQMFQPTEWGQKIGGFISIHMSSSELIEENHEDIYGGLFAGLLFGQALTLSRFSMSINLLLGPGGSVSTLRRSPRHLDFYGEVNVEIGILIAGGLQISTITGFQCIGNLFPMLPGTDYFMYYPVWGISISWV